MKKTLLLYIYSIIIILLVSCKDQNQQNNPNVETNSIEVESLETIILLQDVDTIWTTNPPARITRNIKKDNKGNLIFAAYKDIIRYDGVSFTNISKEEGIDSYDAFDVLEDENGNIWIASTHLGVFRYPTSNKMKIGENPVNHFTTKNGLVHNRSMCIYEDAAGGIWIGTEGGISYYDGKALPNSQLKFRNFTIKEGLTSNNVNAIMEDVTGKIWVGTRGSLSIYNPSANQDSGVVSFTELTNDEGSTFENIWSILEDKKGNIWLGGQNGLWRYDGFTFTNFTKISVMSVYEDKKGNIWFAHGPNGNQKSGLSYFNQKSLLSNHPKTTEISLGTGMFFGITEDKEGCIWVGNLEGVYRYNGKSVSCFKDKKLNIN